MAAAKPLTIRADRFARNYAIHGVGAKAVRESGFSTKNPKAQATKLLADPRVIAQIEAYKARFADERASLRVSLEEQKIYTENRVKAELEAIAFSRITDVCSFDSGGIVLKESGELGDRAIAAIAEVVQTQSQFGVNVRVKMHPKLPALDMCAKELGMILNRVEVSEKKAKDYMRHVSKVLAEKIADPAILEAIALELEALEDA